LPNITVENTETRALITFYYLKDAAMNAQSLASWLPGWRLASLLLQNSTRFPLSRLVSSFTAPTTPVSGGNQGCGSGSGFNQVSGSGSGSKKAKMTHKSRIFFLKSCFEVMDGLF
jgi:hypothetical protein